MIRILLIFAAIFWIIRSVFRFFSIGLGSAQQQRNFNGNRNQQRNRRPSEGNINIDYAPKDRKGKKSSDNFRGGDYVDYEEVD